MSENCETAAPEKDIPDGIADPAGKIRELECAYAELQQQYENLKNRSMLEKISSESGCTDPDYFEFCASRQGIALQDPEALRQFAGQLAAASPGCFRARITPGSSAGTAPLSASPAAGTAEAYSGDRIAMIALSIDNAPDVLDR